MVLRGLGTPIADCFSVGLNCKQDASGQKRPKRPKENKAPARPHPKAVERKNGETVKVRSKPPAGDRKADHGSVIIRRVVSSDSKPVPIRKTLTPGKKTGKKTQQKQTTSAGQETASGEQTQPAPAAEEMKPAAAARRPPPWPDAVLAKDPGSFDTKDFVLKREYSRRACAAASRTDSCHHSPGC